MARIGRVLARLYPQGLPSVYPLSIAVLGPMAPLGGAMGPKRQARACRHEAVYAL